MARDAHAHRVKPHQLAGHVSHGPAHPRLGPGPVVGAQSVQPGSLPAQVLRHHPDLVRGHVQPVALRVLEQEVVALRSRHRPTDHPDVAPHPVHLMDGEVARREFHCHSLRAPASQAGRHPRVAARTEQVLLGDQGQRRGAPRRRSEPEPLFDVGLHGEQGIRWDRLGSEDLHRSLQAPPAFCRQHHAGALPVESSDPLGHGVPLPGPLPRVDAEVDRVRLCKVGDLHALPGPQRCLELADRSGPRPRRGLGQGVGLLQDPRRPVGGSAGRGHHDPTGRREEVAQHRQAVVDQRHSLFHPLEGQALGQPLQQGRVLAPVEGQGEVGPPANLVRDDQLAARIHLHPLDLAGRELGGGGELPKGFDCVAEVVEPDRPPRGRGEQVDDPAAHGELAAVLDHVDPRVPRRHQPLGQHIRRKGRFCLQDKGFEVSERGDQTLDGRQHGRRHDHRARRPAKEVRGCGPGPGHLRGRADSLVGEGLPGGKAHHPVRAEERRSA